MGLTILSNFANVIPLSCISMKNQECKVRPEVINVNSNEPVFYPFSIKTSKCIGICNNINKKIFTHMQKYVSWCYKRFGC